MRPRYALLDEKKLLSISVDLRIVCELVSGCLPQIMQLRDQAATLATVDIAAFDDLELINDGLAGAWSHNRFAGRNEERRAELVAQVTDIRLTLLTDARAMERRKLLPDRITQVGMKLGHRKLAHDTYAIAAGLLERWALIEGRTGVTQDELRRAMVLCEELLQEIAIQRTKPKVVVERAELLQRAFTLLANTWDEVRRVVTFLRWHHGDADAIAPSLYRGQRRKKGSKKRRPAITPIEVGVAEVAETPSPS